MVVIIDTITLESFITSCDGLLIAQEGIVSNISSKVASLISAIRKLYETIANYIMQLSGKVKLVINKASGFIAKWNLKKKPFSKMSSDIDSKLNTLEYESTEVATEATSLATYEKSKRMLSRKFKVASKLEIACDKMLDKFYNIYENMLNAYDKDVTDCINEIKKALSGKQYTANDLPSVYSDVDELYNAIAGSFMDADKELAELSNSVNSNNPLSSMLKVMPDIIKWTGKNFKQITACYRNANPSLANSEMERELIEVFNALGEVSAYISDADILKSTDEMIKIVSKIGIGMINPFTNIKKMVELSLLLKDTGVYAVKFSKVADKANKELKILEAIAARKTSSGSYDKEVITALLKRLRLYSSFSPKKYADIIARSVKTGFSITSLEKELKNMGGK